MALSQQHTPSLLRQMATKLRECRPEEHEVNYKFEAWARCFPGDSDLSELHSRFGGSISRGDIIGLGRKAQIDQTHLRRFIMATMLWGYGTIGYGATRTSAMLAHPQAMERLALGADLVRAGDLADACMFFRSDSRGKLNRFSWSFFTKYFYFVGAASGLAPLPLILDGITREKGVAGGMKSLADAGDPGAKRAMELWWSSADRRCADGYALYVDLVNGWANDLGCRPDAIEMALWRGL